MSTEYVFFIVGLPEAGKDLAANLLSHRLGVQRAASSSIVYDVLAKERGVLRWEIEAAPKAIMEPELERIGNALCEADPCALVAPLLKRGARVIDGIRRRSELVAARAEARTQGMTPVVVWLDRHSIVQDITEITRNDADYVIANHGSVGHMERLIENLALEFQTAPISSGDSLTDLLRLDADWSGSTKHDSIEEEDEEDEDQFGLFDKGD